jgi:thiol-disulfide isomerase/thioredoxin
MRNVVRWVCALLACAAALSDAVAAPALTPWSGGAAPALSLKGLEGGAHTLGAYRGKVVLINFWATWCEPCRLEMPSIQRLRDRFGAKKFAVLAVNVDEPEARVRQYLSQSGVDLTVVMDPNKSATRDWGVRYLPVSFIVGPDGRVRYRVVGDLEWDSDTVVGVISQLIGGG